MSKEFEIMRFNILHAGVEVSRGLTMPYLLAWAGRIYPLYHDDHTSMHRPFADDFRVRPITIRQLAHDLNVGNATENDLLHYSGGDREILRNVLRYIYYSDAMNDATLARLKPDAALSVGPKDLTY